MMEKDIFDRIHEIDFADLSQAERKEYADLFSTEEEFDNMKAFLTKVDDNKAVFAPSDSAKARLDDVFTETYPTENQKKGLMAFLWPQGVPIYRKPLLQVAAVLLLIFTAVPFVQNATKIENNEIAQVDVQEIEKPVSEKIDESIQESNEVELNNDKQEDAPIIEEVEPVILADLSEREPIASKSYSFHVIEDDVMEESAGVSSIASTSDHPDGVFMGDTDEVSAPTSIPTENPNEEIFDLITAVF